MPKMKIGFSLGRTINMGNYESARFEASAEIECESQDRDETFNKLREWVVSKVEREETEWRT